MECFAGVAAVGAKSLFEYNRGNFMYDREQRLKKEFQLQKFRVAQASLWRDDVRDLISLTEYKMHIYLLVNVLLLGFTIVLWCEGRLPSDTPDWLMMGSAVSITGAFMFLLLSMWLAMHAAVAAQSYEARLLTQLVRLPIPTWTEIEACRTYGSDFERIGPRQLLRVPFLAGSQEGLVRQTPQQLGAAAAAAGALATAAPAAEESEGTRRGGGQASCGAGVAAAVAAPPGAAAALAVDPWGYERSGGDIYELGCQHGSQVAKLRHIKLARQAMVYWQSYDAFSRISLSIGINQLLLALSYYILGYILVEVGCRTAATYGVLLLCALAEAMAKLDMSLSMWQLRQIQFLLAFGPIMSCVAAYRWSARSFEAYWFAEALIILSFFSHGLLVALMIRFCCIKPHDNGLMLPTAFRGVLYLDVFGWLRTSPTQAVPGPLRSPGAEAAAPRNVSGQALGGEDLAMLPPRRRSEHHEQRPALMTINTAAGRPVPCCPQDLTPEVAQDFRHMPGAPDPSGSSCTEFYDAEFWLTGDTQEEEGEHELGERDLPPIVTGHEKEVPRILPWRVFCFFAVVLSVAWMLAALYHILGASKAWDFDIPMTWEPESPEEPAGEEAPRPPEELSLNRVVSPESLSLAALHQVMVPGQQPQPEHVPLTWPHQNVKPVGLACDAQGQHFVVTDGLLVYSAELSSGDGPRRAQQGPEGAVAAAQRLRADKAQQRHGVARLSLEFSEVQCAAVAGEGLQDVAVACAGGGDRGCDALVLHRHGRRIAACHLGDVGQPSESRTATLHGQNDTTVLVVSDKWLNRIRDRRSPASNAGDAEDEHIPHTRAEKAVAIATDSTCSSVSQGCALLGTTYGRVVKLQQHPGSQEVLPTEVLREAGTGRGQSTMQWEPGSLRVLQNGHQRLARLEGSARDRQSLLVLGSSRDGVRLRLPASKAAVAFCAGGGFLHFLLQGPSPGMWRIPLPRDL